MIFQALDFNSKACFRTSAQDFSDILELEFQILKHQT